MIEYDYVTSVRFHLVRTICASQIGNHFPIFFVAEGGGGGVKTKSKNKIFVNQPPPIQGGPLTVTVINGVITFI